MKRQHPVALISYTTKNFWLLLIPLIRGLAALKFDFYRWAEGAEWDILAVTVMIAAAVVRWYFTLYEIGNESITVKSGFFCRRRVEIPYKNVTAAASEKNPLFSWSGAVKVYVDTDAATNKRDSADIRLLISLTDRALLFNRLSECFAGEDNGKFRYTSKVSLRSLIAFSFLFSSATSGIVLLITLLSGGTKIVGDKLERDFMNMVNGLSGAVAALTERIIAGISPAGIAISVIIGIGFLMSFSVNIMRHAGFTASRRGSAINISCGMFIKRSYCINSRAINMAEIRQNLLMKLFGIASVHVSCTGYGKRRNEIPVFVPISFIRRNGKDDPAISMLLPGYVYPEEDIKPKITFIGRFIGPPTLLIFSIIAAGFTALIFFPNWYSLISFLTILAEIPAVWLLFVSSCAYCTNGLAVCDGNVFASYCRGWGFHTAAVPRERVTQIKICRSVFQRMGRSCDVIVYTGSEYIGGKRIRNLPYKDVRRLIIENL